MNWPETIHTGILLVEAIIVIWISSFYMVKKKKILHFLPFFLGGISFCFLIGLILEGLESFARDFALFSKLISYSLLLYILWRRVK